MEPTKQLPFNVDGIIAASEAARVAEANALAAGQAVYDKIDAIRNRPVYGGHVPSSSITITLDEWQGFRVWMARYGMTPFGLPTSMEFTLRGVKVVVR